MKSSAIVSLIQGIYTLAKEIFDEVKREKAKQKALIKAKQAAVDRATAHQRAQEKSAIAHKVTAIHRR